MELNREQIKKALEHCIGDATCDRCPLSPFTCHIQEDALSLIKELTEENERFIATVDELQKDKAEVKYLKKRIVADTVQKMKERLKEKAFSVPTVYNAHFGRMIDQIAKEMLEGEK